MPSWHTEEKNRDSSLEHLNGSRESALVDTEADEVIIGNAHGI